MSIQESDRPALSNSAEMFAIAARNAADDSLSLASGTPHQAAQLERLLKRHPELSAVCGYIEETTVFDKTAARVYVVEEYFNEGFMRSRRTQLHGAIVVANFELLRRFDRVDLGLPDEATSAAAIDAHLPFLTRTAPSTST